MKLSLNQHQLQHAFQKVLVNYKKNYSLSWLERPGKVGIQRAINFENLLQVLPAKSSKEEALLAIYDFLQQEEEKTCASRLLREIQYNLYQVLNIKIIPAIMNPFSIHYACEQARNKLDNEMESFRFSTIKTRP